MNSNDNIFLVDEDYLSNLQLYHYRICDNKSEDYVKEYRGVVKSENKTVSKSFGYINEYTVDVDDNSDILNNIHSFNQTKIYPMYEGTIVRMFFWKNKWHLSTHKKLNAFDSKWGNSDCKTFGEMFVNSIKYSGYTDLYRHCNLYQHEHNHMKCENENVLTSENDTWTIFDNFCFQLNTKKTYVFLLQHDENTRIVCKHTDKPSCFHIGEFDNSTHLLVEGNTSGLPSIPTLSFENVNELLEHVRNIDYMVHPGVILYLPNQTQVKLFNSKYKKAQNVRGNQPDILYRYLEIRRDKELSTEFFNLYNDIEQDIMTVELAILELSKSIFHAYMNRYIHKKYVFLPKCEHIVMQMCHKWHIENREINKISVAKVLSVLEDLPTKMLYSIIKNHI